MTAAAEGAGVYLAVLSAYRDEPFARWVAQLWPGGGYDLPWARARWLTRELADFRQHPPERVPAGGRCLLCALPVDPGKGLAVLGGLGPHWGALLHDGCCGEVRRVWGWS